MQCVCVQRVGGEQSGQDVQHAEVALVLGCLRTAAAHAQLCAKLWVLHDVWSHRTQLAPLSAQYGHGRWFDWKLLLSGGTVCGLIGNYFSVGVQYVVWLEITSQWGYRMWFDWKLLLSGGTVCGLEITSQWGLTENLDTVNSWWFSWTSPNSVGTKGGLIENDFMDTVHGLILNYFYVFSLVISGSLS